MPPPSVEHVVLPVVVAEDELVDGLRPVDYLVYEGLAQGILVGAFGTVAYRPAYAAYLTLVYVVAAEEEVVPAVRLDDGRCPQGLFQPWDVLLFQYALVLLPVDEVLAGEGVQVQLLLVGCAEGGEYPIFVTKHYSFGVGIPALENGVATCFLLPCLRCRNQARKQESHDKESFHNCFVLIMMIFSSSRKCLLPAGNGSGRTNLSSGTQSV